MKKALIVGIDDYPSSPLRGCVNDATAIATILESNGDGSPNLNVKLLVSPPKTLSKPVLKEAINQLFEGDCDMALFYFSGHGSVTSVGGYIVTQDYRQYDEGISMDEILTLANNSKARDKIIILDCCHSGALGTPAVSGSHVAQLSEGLSILTASRNSESAMEVNGSGVFTSLVIDALRGGAADLRGHITPGALYAYVDQALGAWDQRPIFKTNVSRFTSLRWVHPQVPLETLRKITDYFPSPETEHQLNPSYEPDSSDPDPTKVAIFRNLQKYEGVGLVVPVGEEHMYYAAMNSKSCRLTAVGHQYWRLAKEKKL